MGYVLNFGRDKRDEKLDKRLIFLFLLRHGSPINPFPRGWRAMGDFGNPMAFSLLRP
jgi:hypothetical protein